MKIKILSLPKHNFADGGDTGNGVTTFSGLKHGQFGLDGIPQGIASDGLPNYVQGGGFDKNGNPIKGEVKYKDYIYGELKITKKLADKFNLPEKWIGLKYQEAANIAQQESKDRPNDPISLTTLDEWMTRLQGAQEEQKYIRDTREAAKALDNMSIEDKAAIMSSLEQPVEQQEDVDLGQPMFAKGGKIHIAKNKRGTFTAAAKKRGMGVQEFANKVLANPENYTKAMRKKAQFAHNAKSFKHEDGGYLFPEGGDLEYLRFAPAVGAGIGALVSAFQPQDYTYANALRALAPEYKPISAQTLSRYRNYTPYDINLANAESMAQQAALQRANRATANRATQMANAIALENAYEKAAASRNLAWQEANEARRAAVDQYNLGINKANADIVQNYDRINQDIRERRIRMLQAAAAAQDASATAWSENVSNNVTNFFNQLGNLGKDQWSKNQLMAYVEEHPELLKFLLA